MTYCDWESAVPETIKADSVWRIQAYRLSLFIADLGWADSERLFKSAKTSAHVDQLRRSTAKISASVSEGYTRNTGKARSTFYEYSAGSAREARDWYYKLRHVLAADVVAHRMDVATQIIKLTLKMVSTERRTNRRVTPE